MGRFKILVDSEEGLESFKAQYRLPLEVGIKYCKEGQWFEERREGEVVIPMIAFIEGGMRIPIGTVTLLHILLCFLLHIWPLVALSKGLVRQQPTSYMAFTNSFM